MTFLVKIQALNKLRWEGARILDFFAIFLKEILLACRIFHEGVGCDKSKNLVVHAPFTGRRIILYNLNILRILFGDRGFICGTKQILFIKFMYMYMYFQVIVFIKLNISLSSTISEEQKLFQAPEPPKSTMEALVQRLEKYKNAEQQAKESGETSKARRMGRIAKVGPLKCWNNYQMS